jgi:serine/threonine protein kinase
MTAPELLGGRYEIRGVIGRGGMATVHDGWDTRLGRPVAIKLLLPTLGIDGDARARFEFEARSAAALNHPNIVVVHDFGEDRGRAYLVMERLPGHSLADTLVRGPLPPDRVRAVLSHVLAGLSAAHAAGILHRDIKPGNVVFDAAGTAKIADFGIAKSAGTDLTQVGQVVGTMAYLSPDRIAGRAATPLDDLYAVGAVGYQALTGRMPYPQSEPAALLRAIAEHQLPPLFAVRPDVDPALTAVIDRAMAPDPAQRFPDAGTMRAALYSVRPSTRVLSAPLGGAPPPWTGAVMPPPPPNRMRKVLAAAAIGAALLLALVLVIAEVVGSSADSVPAPTTFAPTSPATTSTSATSTSPTSTSPTSTVFPPIPRGNGKPPKGPKHDEG